MPSIPFPGEEFRLPISVEIHQLQNVNLREGFVDGVLHPARLRGITLLFQPINAVAMPAAIDDVSLAVVVDVITDDREAALLEIPIALPFPLVLVRIDVL